MRGATDLGLATRNHIRPDGRYTKSTIKTEAITKVIWLSGERQWKAALKSCEAAYSPPRNHSVHDGAGIAQPVPPFAEWQQERVIQDQPLRNVETGQRPVQ